MASRRIARPASRPTRLAPRSLAHLFDRLPQGRGHLAVAAVAAPRLLRLAAAAAGVRARNGLEVGHEHDRAPAPRHLADLPIDHAFRLDGSPSLRRVAVVHDDVRDPACVADAREERDVALATTLEHEYPLLVGLDAERVEDERERQLLGPPLHEQRGAREEQLGAVGVELGERDTDRAELFLAR